jgi:GNAT superfamily N-acetyltransferase
MKVLDLGKLQRYYFAMSKTKKNHCSIRPVQAEDREQIRALMIRDWGGEPLIVHGNSYYPSAMPGLLLFCEGSLQGFLFYDSQDAFYEIIALEVFTKFQGGGTQLLEAFKTLALKEGCTTLKVMTTNDNLDALRFYQRRGFTLTEIALNAADQARQLKPTIPLVGDHNIPLQHELILEMKL